jgi:hypothetical protein
MVISDVWQGCYNILSTLKIIEALAAACHCFDGGSGRSTMQQAELVTSLLSARTTPMYDMH